MGSVIVNVTVECAVAPTVPPMFLSVAETTHGDPHCEVSIEDTR